MSLFLIAALFSMGAQAECGNTNTLVTDAEHFLLSGNLEEAGKMLRQAEESLSCGEVASEEIIARLWLAQGVMAFNQGNEQVAELSFASSHRLSPNLWIKGYGDNAKAIFDRVISQTSPEGTVRVTPDPQGYLVAIDGKEVSIPYNSSSGLHLIQIADSPSEVKYGSMFFLPPNDTYMVLSGLPPKALTVTGPVAENTIKAEIPSQPKKHHKSFIIASSAAAVLSGTAALIAHRQDNMMINATTTDENDAAHKRQINMAATSYSAIGVAAIGIGLYFAI